MTPAPCPRQARAPPPPRERRIAPQHAAHKPAHRPPRALSSALSPIIATPMPSPANSQHPLRTSNQHLPNIPSPGIARPLSCARARLPVHVPPRRTVGLPRPRLPEAQPCLSTCALLVRHSAPVLMRARPQYAGHSCTCPASHARRVGSRIIARIAYGCRHSCRDTQAASVHVSGLQCSAIPCCCPVLSRLQQHSCIAAHMHCSTPWGQMLCCCGLVPIPARAGMGWTLPLNRCSQELAAMGQSFYLSLYLSYKVLSKCQTVPDHQYFPTASPYGAQNRRMAG